MLPLKDYGYFRDFQLKSLWTIPTTSLRQVLTGSETKEAYQWAINWFLHEIDDLDISAIKVILVDCEIALNNVLDSAFPKVRHAICIWHINKTVIANIREILPRKLRAAANPSSSQVLVRALSSVC